jgi:hypothetical protein
MARNMRTGMREWRAVRVRIAFGVLSSLFWCIVFWTVNERIVGVILDVFEAKWSLSLFAKDILIIDSPIMEQRYNALLRSRYDGDDIRADHHSSWTFLAAAHGSMVPVPPSIGLGGLLGMIGYVNPFGICSPKFPHQKASSA